MINYDDIRATLDSHLAALQTDNVAWENSEYVPTEGVGYLRPFLLPMQPAQATVGTNGVDRIAGIYQVDVCEPKDQGSGGVLRKVDSIIAQFARGSDISSNGVTLTVQRSWPGPALSRDAFYVVPVSIYWYTYG